MKNFRFISTFAALFVCFAAAANRAEALPINFDDLGEVGSGSVIPNGYSGLKWQNFRALDTVLEFATYGENGYTNGTLSGKAVGFNFLGATASILSAGGFSVSNLAATAAWRNDLQLTIAAFRNGTQIFTNDYILSTQDPSLITLSLTNINELRFTSSGGSLAGLSGSGTHFALENINVTLNNGGNGGGPTPIPAPPALGLLLASLAGLGLLRKKRLQSDSSQMADFPARRRSGAA